MYLLVTKMQVSKSKVCGPELWSEEAQKSWVFLVNCINQINLCKCEQVKLLVTLDFRACAKDARKRHHNYFLEITLLIPSLEVWTFHPTMSFLGQQFSSKPRLCQQSQSERIPKFMIFRSSQISH
jgi:hypothetical protein